MRPPGLDLAELTSAILAACAGSPFHNWKIGLTDRPAECWEAHGMPTAWHVFPSASEPDSQKAEWFFTRTEKMQGGLGGDGWRFVYIYSIQLPET
jgi:hypothetical protein